MRRYYRGKFARTNQLRASFIHTIEQSCDIHYSHDGGCNTDLHLLHDAFTSKRFGWQGVNGPMEQSLLYELIKRGYDITTLEFSISKVDKTDTLNVNLNQQMLKALK